ncbi:MAG: sigma 54-interacting transcriptional regulator [Desulfobacterales bacterium]|nr:sigma 54-interacting transcriptional regulator [Desulfobacterales bacterium]
MDPTRAGVYVLQRGCFQHANDRLADILGYASPQELIGRSFWGLVHPDDRKQVRLKGKNPTQTQRREGTFRFRKQDGSLLRVHMWGVNTLYEGEPANVGCLIDMSAIGALKESTQKYRTMINEVEDAVAEVDLRGNITFTNVSICKAWRASSEEAVGLNYRYYVDEKSAGVVQDAYQKVYESGKPNKHIVYEIKTKNGRRITVEDSVSLIRDQEGIITGFRTVSRDITGLKEATQKAAEHSTRLEAIFRSVKDAIITVDSHLKVIKANASSETICGVDIATVTGEVFPRCHDHCSKKCCAILRQTLEKKATVKEQRIECGRRRRPQQVVSVSSSPLLDPSGRFLGAVLVIRDITLLLNLERELKERHQFRGIIGQSEPMRKVYRLVESLADLDTTVLITGESGTGKELVARDLHYRGRRAIKPFVTVNCSALAESLLESELFGHVRGAFTGAMQDKQGRFEVADGGTILLDEIGDVSPLIQLKLLRVLQEKEFERVGESVSRKVDVRIVACTNKELKQKVINGEFREDLYYRLKVMEIALPPLRERTEDVPLLVEHFCRVFNARFHKSIEGISSDVLERLVGHYWPGNVRELEHVIERAFVLCHGRGISLEHLPPEIRNTKPSAIAIPIAAVHKSDGARDVLEALSRAYWNRTKAADLLGVSRQTLYRKIHAYKIFEMM